LEEAWRGFVEDVGWDAIACVLVWADVEVDEFVFVLECAGRALVVTLRAETDRLTS